MDKHSKILNWFSWTAIGIGFMTILLVAYMLFWPVCTIKYLDDRVEVSPLTVKHGELINLHLRYTKFTDAAAVITVSFADTIFTDAITYQSLRKHGEYDHWRAIQVPATLIPGRYHVIISIRHVVNPLRTNVTEVRSIYFDVVK